MDEIGKILPSLFRKQIRREEPRLLEILLPLWPRIAGKSMAQHSQPSFFSSGVLTLAADCDTWGTQLRHMSEEIRAEINSFLGQAVVKKLRIRTVNPTAIFSLPPQPKYTTAQPVLPAATKAMDTGAIADHEVAVALARSYAKYFNRARR